MAKPNLDKLSFKEITEIQEEASEKLESMKVQSIEELQKKIIILIEEERFTIEEVIEIKKFKKLSKKNKKKLNPKYRNPKNEDETWVGKGPQPQWFKDFEKGGGDREKILIEKSK
jgi:DNA-binding protein H-NS